MEFQSFLDDSTFLRISLVSVATASIVALCGLALARCVRRRTAIEHAVLLTSLFGAATSPVWAAAAMGLPGAATTTEADRGGIARSETTLRSVVEVDDLHRHSELCCPIVSALPSADDEAKPVQASVGTASADTSTRASLLGLGVVIWIGVTAALLLRIAIGSMRIENLRRSAVDFALPEGVARRLKTRFGLARLPRVATASRVAASISIGVVRPAILLNPRLVESLSSEQLGDVLLHETAHLVRRDGAVLLAERLIAALLWPALPIHFVCRRLDDLREALCDDHATGDSGAVDAESDVARRIAYSETLFRVAQLTCRERNFDGALAFLGRRSQLETRIAATLDTGRRRAGRATFATVAGTIAFLALSAGVSTGLAMRPQPTPSADDPRIVSISVVEPGQRAPATFDASAMTAFGCACSAPPTNSTASASH